MSYSTQKRGIGDPACPVCDGMGYVTYNVPDDHADFGRMFTCQCREVEHSQQQMDRLRKIGGLEALSEKRLDTFNTQGMGMTDMEQSSLQNAFAIAAAYAENPSGWLVLRGGYGVGKTHLAAAIANRQLELGHKAVFVSVPDLLDYLRATYRGGNEGYDERFAQIRNAKLLVLDDLGMESPTSWAIEKLYQIFNHRYNSRLATVITTNHDLEELELRLRSRLSDPDITQIVYVRARDYRMGSGSSGHSDLSSLGLFRDKSFDNFDPQRSGLSREQQDNLVKAYEIAIQYAENPYRWLAIIGGYGSGKTHLAAAIANARQDMGDTVLFITVPDLLDHLRATYAPNSPVSYDKRLSEIRSAPLLVLDDLGTESATPWAREKLYQVFNYRYAASLPTVITTVYELRLLDERLASRLQDPERCRVFALRASPYRGNGA